MKAGLNKFLPYHGKPIRGEKKKTGFVGNAYFQMSLRWALVMLLGNTGKRQRRGEVRGPLPHSEMENDSLLLEGKPRPTKQFQITCWPDAGPGQNPAPDLQTWLFSASHGSPPVGHACGAGRVKSDSKPQPAGEETLVSEGAQGFHELPLCSWILGNSPGPTCRALFHRPPSQSSSFLTAGC